MHLCHNGSRNHAETGGCEEVSTNLVFTMQNRRYNAEIKHRRKANKTLMSRLQQRKCLHDAQNAQGQCQVRGKTGLNDQTRYCAIQHLVRFATRHAQTLR
jgi:hypothetical protein